MILDFFFIAIIIKFSEKSFMLVSMYLIYIGIVGGLKNNNLVEKMLCIFIYALFLWKISIVWNDVLIYIFSCMLREIALFILKNK
jgi:hypothetical protein